MEEEGGEDSEPYRLEEVIPMPPLRLLFMLVLVVFVCVLLLLLVLEGGLVLLLEVLRACTAG